MCVHVYVCCVCAYADCVQQSVAVSVVFRIPLMVVWVWRMDGTMHVRTGQDLICLVVCSTVSQSQSKSSTHPSLELEHKDP